MSSRIRVAAFTGGYRVPSSRFRVHQYLASLARLEVRIHEFSAPLGMYPPKSNLMRPGWALLSAASRIPAILRSYSFDLTLLQREMISTYITLEPLTHRPRVLDVDDAIWLHRRGRFAGRLASLCDGVICGNSYLADYFRRVNSNVTILPTPVDTERYHPANPADRPVIGWSGSSSGFQYLYAIEPALATVLKQIPAARLRIVADREPQFTELPQNRIEYIRWSPEIEVQAIQSMAAGIMPLKDSEWERGKCSFKMLTYMACGVPVVVSRVGMNTEVLAHGPAGFGADTRDDWIQALLQLMRDAGLRLTMGQTGRRIVTENYSTDVLAPRLAAYLRSAAGQRP